MGNDTSPLTLRAHAKINLFIHVVGRRADGYHDIETLFQFLDVHDTLSFQLENHGSIERRDEHEFVLPDFDLAVNAAQLLRDRYGDKSLPGVTITLNKIIPPGSGMGGGSSNAATTLVAMNHLWELGLSRDQLLSLGAELGADVPVFIYGHACWATERGDRMQHYEARESWYCIALPNVSVSTATVFADPELDRGYPSISPADYSFDSTTNALQPVTEKHYPEVAKAVTALGRFGDPRMNGSGSSVFLQCESRIQAESVQSGLPADLKSIVSRSLNNLDPLDGMDLANRK